MVVCLDLDQGMEHFVGELPSAGGVIRGPEVGHVSLKDGSVVAIRGDGEVWNFCVGVLDHFEETFAHGLSVDSPGRIEDFVPTMPVQTQTSENIMESETRLDTCLPQER